MTNESSPSLSSGDQAEVAVEEGRDWKFKMLQRLLDHAPLVPIKVACVAPPPGKPEYLNEEYHGRISKEEEKRLLDGKSGRYLVRDPTNNEKSHEYTLAFNFDSEIKYVKLLYSPQVRKFKTPEQNEKEYRDVLSLMVDVLSLFQSVKQKGNGAKRDKYEKPHAFKVHNYKYPKWCDECGKFLWGIYNQGFKCEDCGMNVHHGCKGKAPVPCSNVHVIRKFSSKIPKKTMTIDQNSTTKSIDHSLPPAAIKGFCEIRSTNEISGECSYFQQCSTFLSAYNIRDKFTDINNPLTRCFCDSCLDKSRQHSPGVICESIKHWTRFHLTHPEDVNISDVKNWDVVYFAVQPKCITKILDDCYAKAKLPKPWAKDFELVVAPSLAYTAQDMVNENWSITFPDTLTSGNLHAQIVFEVYVRPDSYIILPNIVTNVESSCYIDHNVVPEHWKISNIADIFPRSILVKIFKEPLQNGVFNTI